MRAKNLNEAGARGGLRTKLSSAKQAVTKSGFYQVKSLLASGAREFRVHGADGRIISKTPLFSPSPKGGAKRAWVIVVSPTRRKVRSIERLLQNVVEVTQEAGVEAVEQALAEARAGLAKSASNLAGEGSSEAEAERWARIRREWLETHRSLTAAEVAGLAGSNTVNPSGLLQGWVKAGRVFAVQDGKTRRYPAFQLGDDGQPKPGFRTLLAATAGRLEGWPLAVWLTRPNAEFEGWRTPLEMIERDPEAVAAAARRDTAAPAF